MKRVFAHIGFSSAIALIVACLVSTKFVIVFTVGLAVLFIASLSLSYFRRNVTFPLCFGSALLSCIIFLVAMHCVVAPQLALNDTEADISFYTIDKEKQVDTYEYVYTARASVNGGKYVKMRIKSSCPINTDYYTYINGHAKLYKISDSAYSSFGYWSDSIFLTAVLDDDFVVTDNQKPSLMPYVLHFRDNATNTIMRLVGSENGGVAVALITGDKSYIDPVVNNYFRFSGVSHIMAVSGLHLFVVAGVLLFVLRKLRVSDAITSPLIIALIIMYSALVGFSASVVRAGIMMIVMLFARMVKSVSDSLNSLGIAVFIICLNPFAVADIGAMLSVLSALSLIISSYAAYNRYSKHMDMDNSASEHVVARGINRLLAMYMTLFVMAFTLPVMYIFYGYASVASYVANFVVVPLGELSIIFSSIMLVLNWLGLGAFTKLFAFITKHIISALVGAVKFLASFNGSTIRLDKFFGVILAGALLIIAVCFIYNNGVLLRKGIAIAVAFSIACCGVVCLNNAGNSSVYITEDGAIVVDYNDTTIVSNVRTYSDFYNVLTYLTVRHSYIDLLVLDGNSEESAQLTQSVVTNMVLTNELNEIVLDTACYKDIELKNKYTVDFGSGLVLDYYYGDYTISVDGVDIVASKKSYPKSDIVINKKSNIVKDKYGKINLDDGDILYTIKDSNYFVRRMV